MARVAVPQTAACNGGFLDFILVEDLPILELRRLFLLVKASTSEFYSSLPVEKLLWSRGAYLHVYWCPHGRLYPQYQDLS